MPTRWRSPGKRHPQTTPHGYELRRISPRLDFLRAHPALRGSRSADWHDRRPRFNPANGEYIRNVEVRIEGTQLVAISEDGGYYRLTNTPSGDVNLVASYIGHETITAKVNVAAGATTSRDFELRRAPGSTAGEPIQLGAFVVSAELDGQAKAISEQKEAMNVKTVVAFDNFRRHRRGQYRGRAHGRFAPSSSAIRNN